MNKEIQPENLPSECVELVDRIIPQLPIKAEEAAYALVFHLKYLVALSRDAIFLESEGRSRSTPVIARAVLEALFKVMVALKNPEIAATQTLLEFEWDSIQTEIPGSDPWKIDEIRAKPEYATIGQRVGGLASRWGLAADAHRKTSKYSTQKWASDAGMADIYKGRYAQLSNYSHATAGSFWPPLPTYVLTTISFALLRASLRLAERYRDAISEACQASAKFLWQMRCEQTQENLIRFAIEQRGFQNSPPRSPNEKLVSN